MEKRRPLRSYVLRAGRLTRGQQRALDELWCAYGLALPAPGAGAIDLARAFGRAAPARLEIGFGDGDALLELAEKNPDCNFLGAEVHRPGVGRLLRHLKMRNLTNIRIFCDDAIEVLTRAMPASALEAVYLYFPDPWPKKRHHKRRLVQPPFIELTAAKLARGGHLHFATDWQAYAEHALECLMQSADLENCATSGGFSPRPPQRPLTKFERRGIKLGHRVW
ncbi:MAG: tRNA (guanosine(46)-N7)-methyltransferase TrmB, partial [Gammaproteobacteria bacterium]